MGEYEDLLDEVRDQGLDDLAEKLGKFSASKLRKAAERVPVLEQELATATSRVEELETKPKREKAFRDYGVDFDSLKPAELETISGLKPEEGEPTPEWIAQVVEKYDLPTTQVQGNEQGSEEEPSGARQVVNQATTSNRTGTPPGRITPVDAEKWPVDKTMRFQEKYPDEWEALLRGDEVHGVVFA